ncbi:uncharacterized protein LOC124421415 [Lucilia cuprina]|uniref:uncharacterized protein LOC124421415 n=1 Tax=Lucilia cuprina TaxID=7375 RepID=UPI001F061B7A|nr:uncharacterized protein LOC124421415 [Lucilia cuprina]
MSYLQAIFEFIKNFCDEDDEFKKMCQEIEQLNRENLKLERDIEECDREYVRLQIEQHNLQTVTSGHLAVENCDQMSMGIFQQILELNSLLKQIDFGKIVKCHHMEMETKFLKESQPIQEAMSHTQEWYEKMEQRSIVRKYRQVAIANREAEEKAQKELDAMRISGKESMDKLLQAKDKRNALIVAIIQEAKEIEAFKEKLDKLNKYKAYIEGLRQEKLLLLKQLDDKQLKSFNPNITFTSNSRPSNICPESSNNIEVPKLIVPNLPSLEEILMIFNQPEENKTTLKKPILHNTTYDQSTSNKQNKNVSFKMPLEEFHEYPQQEMETELETETEPETETESEYEELKQQVVVEITTEKEENLQEINEIETIDLLTPTEKESAQINESLKTVTDKEKPLIEIQECIVFKAPFPMQQVTAIQDSLTVSEITMSSNSKQTSNDKVHILDDTPSSSKQSGNSSASLSSNAQIKDILNTTKMILNDELTSSSAEVSPRKSSLNKKSYLKDDFEAFFRDNEDEFWTSNETPKAKATNETADFLDFGPSKGFTFDSDDNTADNVEIMDFM